MTKIPAEQWLPIAESLAIGGSVRVVHEGCSRRNNLVISNKDNCLSAYCFSCGGKGYKPKEYVFTKEVNPEHNSKELPDDLCRCRGDIRSNETLKVRKFLQSKGLYIECIPDSIDVYYSAKANRVIFSRLNNKQGRALGQSKAKWISYGSAGYFPVWGSVYSKVVVLTEDILSAIKIAWSTDFQVSCIALMGTKPKKELLGLLLDMNLVIIALDGDEAGATGTFNIKKQLDALEVPCKQYPTPWGLDPKDEDSTEIYDKMLKLLPIGTLK